MRFLVDADLSPRVAELLSDAGHDAEHVEAFDVLRVSDDMLLAFAASEDRVLVSSYADFEMLFSGSSLTTPSLVLFRSAEGLPPDEQVTALLANLALVAPELESGAIVTITDGQPSVRILPMAADGAPGEA